MHPFFIKNTKKLAIFQSQIYSLFHENKTLPEQVFKQQKHYYLFEEFHWVLSEEGWEMLKSLAHHHHDEFILMAVLEQPDDMNRFHVEFGYFDWLKIPLNITEDEYLSILTDYPKHSKNDCIMNIASRVVWASPTLRWAIYGERDFEICILGIDQEIAGKTLGSWRPLDNLVLDWVSVVFPDQIVPDEFQKKLAAHYKFKGQ
ncbi:hypothetical protein IGX41_04400 [Bacillus velezensis]|uniref:Uncharacterized protein n=1 Tax=Bacillus velezensis TaxID=492670 RepID=A0ABC8DEZ2_BACVE|nr:MULTISPECIES: hypothetical protein [Bacillus]AJC25577.1 hypothetical protein SB24_10615 [Bacillus sp. Pc3]ANB47649.1 hypothetical protein A1D33_010115 [Bacillus velezensis]AVI30644.1 hypothetical protein C3Z10_20665 [Bacillus velezensis]AWD89673.1 hypothetical protein BVQ_20385 [Bacillus velezensis]AWM53587.1 hypothetical protein DDT10_18700 [Bacillus amyloliquefaciens]